MTFAGRVSADMIAKGFVCFRNAGSWRWSVVDAKVHARKDMEGQLDAWWGSAGVLVADPCRSSLSFRNILQPVNNIIGNDTMLRIDCIDECVSSM